MLYLYNKIGRGDVSWEGTKVDSYSSILMGCQLGIILIIQGDTGEGSSDGGWVTGIHLLENDWNDKAIKTARVGGVKQGSMSKVKVKEDSLKAG